ncbi:multisubunit sodium/proton antiporter, MrpB subunit [Halobiforma haloterrestris]|uniref:Multisubunit sodium/proton antiporter, MrpB subunit n=1 Tax=Natronobacterium haloterrestre TaxID=148448 RepID=A0A1I1F7R0_NATHA|nr:MnhB domain-containing protein [Halobiforma haloterrestris]SFB93183.1 multisubunit sodium/proton antiporter, MrpB subunit [Halobiforma haloterrestris]
MSDANSRTDSYDDTYTESQVIMTTVKIIAPFTLTYGLFLVFHGANTPGGSFQGGTIVGVTVLMLAFAFGIEPTRRWLRDGVLVGLATGGVAIFTAVGLGMIALGGNFLEYDRLYYELGIKQKWGLEAIEIGGISLIVSSVIITLFFAMAAGFTPDRQNGARTETGAETPAERRDRGRGAGSSDTEVSDDD